MTTVYLYQSDRKDKRYKVVIQPENFTVYFGDPRYQNFTMHKDEGRKRLYLIRHEKNENWKDIKTSGFSIYDRPARGTWSKWLLWNLPTISQSIKDIEQRFRIKIMNKTS